MAGFKHLIECHCYLSIFKNKEKIINHRFPVYSKIDDLGNMKEKVVKCNNCEALHKIKGCNQSEIIPGKDESNIIITIEDLRHLLPAKVLSVLVTYKSDISNWEHALDIIEDSRWEEPIVLKREIVNNFTQVKIMYINPDKSVRIINEKIENVVGD